MDKRRFLTKSITFLLGVFLVTFGVCYFYCSYQINNSPNSDTYDDVEEEFYCVEEEYYSDNIVNIGNVKYNITQQCVYSNNGILITDSVDWVYQDQSGESIVPFSRNDRRGFINTKNGSIIISPKYDHAWVFREGLAAVDIKGELAFIDTIENIKIRGYRYSPNKDFYFKNGVAMVGTDSLVGLIDKNNNWVLTPIYDYIRLYDKNNIHAILPCRRIQVFNADGKKLNDCYINKIFVIDDNPDIYMYESDINCYGLMNEFGERISEPLYRHIRFLRSNILCYDENGNCDVYNKSGNLIFSNITEVSIY